MLFCIEKPDLSQISQKRVVDLISNPQDKLTELVAKAHTPNYEYWDKVKHYPLPKGVKPIELWSMIKFFRKSYLRYNSVIKSESGRYFTFTTSIPNMNSFFHTMDMNLGGNISLVKDVDEHDKQLLVSRGIMDEAIATSQLEGAITTRQAAKQFLREGRKPKNTSEHMILNAYQTNLYIETELKNEKLDEEKLLNLHKMITNNTIQPDDSGRLRTDEDEIVVGEETSNTVYHVPPKRQFIETEIKRLLAYANDETIDALYVHPVLKAIFLHFWIGYLHPFTDGNGRIARALFYWYLLKNDYWAISYLPISKTIKRSPAQYRNAYIYSEQDDLDLMYFTTFNIKKIEQAAEEFKHYLELKRFENRKMCKLSRSKYKFNDRQIHLLQYLYEKDDASTSVKVHSSIHKIHRLTARTDLIKLRKSGFLLAQKKGKEVHYFSTTKVAELFK